MLILTLELESYQNIAYIFWDLNRQNRKNKFVMGIGAELEVNALNRRIQGLEEDLEKSEDKLLIASQKLDKEWPSTHCMRSADF